MKRYISHMSALKYWDFPLAQSYFEPKFSLNGTEQFTVTHRSQRFSHNKVRSHICSRELPKGSFTQTNGIDVVSPSLMFVQLATELDIHELIILGNLLCSRPYGPYSKPQLTKTKLLNYVRAASGLSGRKKALRALNYINNDACSIMEVFLAMFLSLPHALGGLGLKGGIFNYRLSLDDEGINALKKDTCFIDYCFPKEKIAYEYQGEIHSNTIDQDSSRIMALTRQKFTVITVTKSQLYDPGKLSQLLFHSIQLHNVEKRTRTKRRELYLHRIRELLPSQDNKPVKSETLETVTHPLESI